MLRKLILISLVVATIVNADESDSDKKPPKPCQGNICQLPVDPGDCKDQITLWFFNPQTCKCQTFNYSGCGGNGNRFNNEGLCHKACIETCQQPKLVGPCKAAMPRWFYNSAVGECKQFIYGGCSGNGNNFETEKACEDECENTE